MDRRKLVAAVAKRTIYAKWEINEIVEPLLETILKALQNGDEVTPWNRGLSGCYSDEFMANMKRNQTNRKEIYRFDMDGNFIDSWISVRTMCAEFGFDRRTVQRCLNKRPNFISHKGYMFSHHIDEVPVYNSKSIVHGKYSKRHGKTS